MCNLYKGQAVLCSSLEVAHFAATRPLSIYLQLRPLGHHLCISLPFLHLTIDSFSKPRASLLRGCRRLSLSCSMDQSFESNFQESGTGAPPSFDFSRFSSMDFETKLRTFARLSFGDLTQLRQIIDICIVALVHGNHNLESNSRRPAAPCENTNVLYEECA